MIEKLSRNIVTQLEAGPTPIIVRLAGLDQPDKYNQLTRLARQPQPTVVRVAPGSDARVQDTAPPHPQAQPHLEVPTGQFAPRGVDGELLVTPVHLGAALLAGFDQGERKLGVWLDGVQYCLNTPVFREQEQWRAQNWVLLQPPTGVMAAPAIGAQLFPVVLRGLELAFLSAYREFVLAEAAVAYGMLKGWQQDNQEMRKQTGRGEPTEAAREAAERVYRLRFSGKIGECRAHLARLVQYLEQHPEGAVA